MELRQIEYFIEVAKREHVTEAALNLHVAQSAVSRQIFNLEAELGVELFIREGRSVRLTPIGRSFLEHMEQVKKVIDNAKGEITDYLDPERGTVRIGFPSSLAAYTLPTTISAFREQYPNVKFQLNQGSYHELVEGVVKGEFDLALIGPLPRHAKKVTGKTLFTEKIVALLPINHPLAEQPHIELNQLRNDSFILFPKGFILHDMIVDACEQQGFQPTVSFEGKDIDAIKGLVSAGLGIALIPEITLIDSLPRLTVKKKLVKPTISRSVGIIIPAERKLLPTEVIFYEFIQELFSKINQFQNDLF